MKELDFATLFSVFQEMLGVWLWPLILAVLAITAGFAYVMVRDRRLSSRRLVRAELLAPLGGLAAVLFMQFVTHSGFADIGGPIDVMLTATIFVAGAIGTMMLAYLLQSLRRAG